MADRLFNTNETHCKNAHNQMIAQSCIALYGYPVGRGEHKLSRPRRGDRVFAYVNERGIIASGTIRDDRVFPSTGIFHPGAERELRRCVDWDCVVNPERAVSMQLVAEWEYNLPVRCTIADISDSGVCDRIERELRRRGDDRL